MPTWAKIAAWASNPKNWPAIWSAVGSAADLVKRAREWLRSRKVAEANESLERTEEVSDDQQRVEAKAEAQCELEKAQGASDCDKPHPGRVWH